MRTKDVVLAVMLMGWACRIPPPPPDLVYRSYFRLVYHTSPFNVATVVDAQVAHQVWWDNPIPRYQTEAFAGSFHGYREPCRLEILMTGNTAALSRAAWPLVPDSAGDSTGFRFTQRTFSGTETYTTDGQRLFDTYYNINTPDTVLVLQLPRLITVDENGNDLPRGFNGIAFEGDHPDLYSPFNLFVPSIWINTRVALVNAPRSVFAHEIAHVFLREPPTFPTVWGDNSTAFLHIQTSVQFDKLRWFPNPGVMGLESATDTNRQVLVEADGWDECFDAKSSRFVKWDIAP